MTQSWNIPGMFSQMRERMEGLQQALERREVEALVGGGMVKVKANGRGRILRVDIDPQAMGDKAMLEDLIVAATNQAIARAQEMAQQEMQQLLGPFAGPLTGMLGKFGL